MMVGDKHANEMYNKIHSYTCPFSQGIFLYYSANQYHSSP